MIEYRGEQIHVSGIDDPDPPTLTRGGAAGETTYGYKVVALRGGAHSAVSTEATLANGPAALTTLHYIDVKPPYVSGAVAYDIYRTTGGAAQGYIGSVQARVQGSTQLAFLRDAGRTAHEATPPTSNTSGQLTVDGALTATGLVILSALPSEDPGVAGALYVDESQVVKVSLGD
jgi:hypothetical protein